MARRMWRSNSFSRLCETSTSSRFAMPTHDKFDALVPTSASSPPFKRTSSALTQLCSLMSDDTHFALDANLAAMRGGDDDLREMLDANLAGRGGDEDMMASEPSEHRRADDLREMMDHLDPRRRRRLESAGHLFG